LNITCNLLYCNHQVHRDFLITLYYFYSTLLWNFTQRRMAEWVKQSSWTGRLETSGLFYAASTPIVAQISFTPRRKAVVKTVMNIQVAQRKLSSLPSEQLPTAVTGPQFANAVSQVVSAARIAEQLTGRQQVCGAPCYLYNCSYSSRHV
jgi:hypothetical protein